MSDQQVIAATTATQIVGVPDHCLIAIQTLGADVYLSRTSKNAAEDFKLSIGDILVMRIDALNLFFYSTAGCTISWIVL